MIAPGAGVRQRQAPLRAGVLVETNADLASGVAPSPSELFGSGGDRAGCAASLDAGASRTEEHQRMIDLLEGAMR